MDGRTDGLDGRMDGWIDGQTDGRTNGMDTIICTVTLRDFTVCVCVLPGKHVIIVPLHL